MPATLASIRIKNFALVDDLVWSPGAGFNAVTGETGAGKSVLIGALQLLLGERADRGLIRAGAESCAVEALFETADSRAIDSLLADAGAEPCEQGRLIVKRTLGASTGRQFVNSSPCNLTLLKRLGDLLVDLHGPHDHQSLFSREQQTRLLDEYSGLDKDRACYVASRDEWLALCREQHAMTEGAQSDAREIDLLGHQVREIDAAELVADEEEELIARHHAASNARRIQELGAAAAVLLDGGDGDLTSCAGELGRTLRELARFDARIAPLEALQVEISERLGELARGLAAALDRVDADPAVLQQLEERLDLLGGLKRKYGTTIPEILGFCETARRRLGELERRRARGRDIDREVAASLERTVAAGRRLSAGRSKGAARLGREVASQLLELGFKQAGFEIAFDPAGEPGPNGLELAEFIFAPNPGEPPQPLRQIASSGEISRVMLALKCALAAQDRVSLLVFDEIDANVGGETATRIGHKLRELGRVRQILCITHLPQVAACAGAQFLVHKSVQKGRSVSEIEQVSGGRRVREIARMLGGASDSALSHAREMLGGAQ